MNSRLLTRLMIILAVFMLVNLVLLVLNIWALRSPTKAPAQESGFSMSDPTNRTPATDQQESASGQASGILAGTDIKITSWIPYWDQTRAVAAFRGQVDLFDMISVFWHRIDAEGELTTYEVAQIDESIIEFAHDNDVAIMATVANLPDYDEGGTWDPERVDKVIATPEARQAHIRELMDLVENYGFDGVDIDYEALRRDQREDFSVFIRELGQALHEQGKLLGVAIHPKTGEFKPEEDNGSHAQDWQAIHPYVDQMYFMTYDEHNEDTPPGPIASPAWIEEVLDYAITTQNVPEDKVFLGIPLYGYCWTENPMGEVTRSRGLEYDEIEIRQDRLELDSQFDPDHLAPVMMYTRHGRQHTVWYENAESVGLKLETAARYGLGGVGFWRIGREDKRLWQEIRSGG